MSSILDALRELESTRPRKPTQVVTPVETPGRADRAFDAVMPLAGGIAVGAIVFGAAVWALTRLPPAPVAEPPAAAPASEAASPARPSWLDTAEAPRARVGSGPAAARAPRAEETEGPARPAERTARPPDPPARAAERTAPPAAPPARAAEPAARPADPPVAAASPRSEPRPRATASGPLVVEMIHYSPMAAERTVTLRVNGRRVTLHQRESADGLEVQLIQPDSVYVQRGSEVFLVTLDR